MKHIVVVYSHSGAAYNQAEAFAKAHNADLFRIEPTFEPKGFFTYVVRGYQASLKKPCKLKPDNIDLKQYDKMTLFAPIHAGKMSAPIRSYLFTHRTYLPKVDVVLTHLATDDDYKRAATALENELKFKFENIDSIVIDPKEVHGAF